MASCIIYDPTVDDKQSKVRGVGRYMQILRENLPPSFTYSSNLRQYGDKSLSLFLNPFFNLLQTPCRFVRIAKKQIAVVHDLIPLKYPSHFPIGLKGRMNMWLNIRTLKRHYDLIITDSQASKKDIIEKLQIPSNKIQIVYPTLPKSFLHSKLHNLKLKIGNFLLYVGDATWNKNLVNLAHAIKMADIPCVFVGKVFGNGLSGGKENIFESQYINKRVKDRNFRGDWISKLSFNAAQSRENCDPNELLNPWQKELKEFLKLAKGDKRFIFPGFVSDEQLIALYQNAMMNILVSRDEGFGFSYLEASSQKCPSILSDIPVFREIAQDTALFVNSDDPKNITNAVKKLIESKEERSILSKKAYDRSLKFGKEIFQKKLLEIVEKLQ